MSSHQDSKKRLVQTALKLFASRGYHGTSIADIVEESGCTRGTLYHYFSSKEALGYAAIDESARLLVEEGVAWHLGSNEHPVDRMLSVLDNLPSTLRLEMESSPVIGLGARMATVHDGFREHTALGLRALTEGVEGMVRKGVGDGQIADSVDPRQVAHVAMTMAHGIQMASLLGHREVISEELRRWIEVYLNSLRK